MNIRKSKNKCDSNKPSNSIGVDPYISTTKKVTETTKFIDIISEQDLKEAEEFAYYIKQLSIPFNMAIKKYGVISEQILLIKLIYARDYYLAGEVELGDKLLQEVETSFNITDKITNILNELKTKRNEIILIQEDTTNPYSRKKRKRI